MQDIVTITLNPAVDISAEAERVLPGPKLRCHDQRIDPGGGGVNVSRAIKRLGGRSTAIVALAGTTGRLLEDLLGAEGIRTVAIRTGGLTRQSFAVTAGDSGAQFRFVMAGPTWAAADVALLMSTLAKSVRVGTLAVLSGSLPPGVDPEAVSTIKAQVHAAGGRLLLDTSGPALERAGRVPDAEPTFLLRMDGAEARDLSGRKFAGPDDLAAFGREMVSAGIAEHVVLSLGAEGTAGVTATELFGAGRMAEIRDAVTVRDLILRS